jgi:TolA-binding protein
MLNHEAAKSTKRFWMNLNRFVIFVASWLILLLMGAGETRGDTLWVVNASGKEVAIGDVRIGRVEGGNILYEDASGKRGQRELAQVTRIEMEDEPALSAAERAYAKRDFSAAAEGYEKALAGTRRDWVRAWIAPRLVEAGENSGRFGAAVVGYLALVRTNSTRAENLVPAAPETDQKALDDAVVDVKGMLAEAGLSAGQRQCLLNFLVDIHRARHDQGAADAVLDQMQKSGNVGATRAIVRRKLDEVAKALEKERWKEAVDLVKANDALFVEARDQAEAMYFLAEAQSGGAQDTSDPNVLKDVGLAYIRVVAHFKDVQGAPFVAASLLKTGAIEERLGDEKAARRVYEQVAREFSDSPAGAAARGKLNRMAGK